MCFSESKRGSSCPALCPFFCSDESVSCSRKLLVNSAIYKAFWYMLNAHIFLCLYIDLHPDHMGGFYFFIFYFLLLIFYCLANVIYNGD